MGQRHQLFAVAKINGRYRTLAVTHHQWLYGYDVIKRCFSLLDIFRANAAGINRELRRAEKLDWARDVPKDKQITSGPFFPFIANTLFLGTAGGGAGGDGAFVYLLSLNTTPDDCINDDGFTIFDMSDPANPRYAFFMDDELIGPWEYFEPYANQQHVNFACKEKMMKLECMSKVEVSVVSELWPLKAGRKWTSSQAVEVPPAWVPEAADVDDVSSKLKDMTLAKVVDEALTSAPEDATWIAHAAQLADFRPALRARLQEKPSLLHPLARVSVLGIAFEACDVVDLRLVDDLKAGELLAIIKHLASAEDKSCSVSLTLPNMRELTAGTLKEILNTATVTSLDLGDTAIKLEVLLKLISKSNVSKFLCPALYKRAFDIKVTNSKHGAEGLGGICKPATPASIFPNGGDTFFPLAQVIYVRQYRSASYPRLHSGGLNWERVLQTLGPDVNLGGTRSRTVNDKAPNVLVMPVQDVLLSTKAIAEVVPRMVKQILELPGKDVAADSFSKGTSTIAVTLAMGMTDDNNTHPISAEAFAAWKTHFSSSDNTAPLIQTSTPGSWSLLVFHECVSPKDVNTVGPQQQPEVRYGFYTTAENGSTRAVDAAGFFSATASEKEAAGLAEKWQTEMSKLERCAEPMDEERRGHFQKGKVIPASAAEVSGGLKLVKCYNEQVKKAVAKAGR